MTLSDWAEPECMGVYRKVLSCMSVVVCVPVLRCAADMRGYGRLAARMGRGTGAEDRLSLLVLCTPKFWATACMTDMITSGL